MLRIVIKALEKMRSNRVAQEINDKVGGSVVSGSTKVKKGEVR